MSGEDLTTWPGVSVQHDLALVVALGVAADDLLERLRQAIADAIPRILIRRNERIGETDGMADGDRRARAQPGEKVR